MARTLNEWQEKLAFLQEQEPTTADPDMQYSLQKKIRNAQAKINELSAPIAPDATPSLGMHDTSRINQYAPDNLIGRWWAAFLTSLGSW